MYSFYNTRLILILINNVIKIQLNFQIVKIEPKQQRQACNDFMKSLHAWRCFLIVNNKLPTILKHVQNCYSYKVRYDIGNDMENRP